MAKDRCAEIIQSWGFWRDQGRWSELAGTFHEGGTISVTWFSGMFADFIERSRVAFEARQSLSKHRLGQPMIESAGDRAIAETDVTILGRFRLDGILVDNTSYGRFLDRFELRAGKWAIVERIAVYEKDRLDPVEPSAAFDAMMKKSDFIAFPEPYRYLGYRLTASGRPLSARIYCDRTPETEELYRKRKDWLNAANT
jgi:hypothetical protein